MAKLQLSFAMTAYDRVTPLIEGEVKVDGVDLEYQGMPGAVPRVFYDQIKFNRYDVSEMSMSSFLRMRPQGFPYLMLPVFHNRQFSYTNVYIRKASGIRQDQPTNVTIANNLWYLLGQDPNGGSTNLNLPSGPGNTHWTGADPFVDWQNGNFALKPGHSLNTAGSDGGPVGATFGPVEADTTPPSVPSNVQATANSSSAITVSWNASTDKIGRAHV